MVNDIKEPCLLESCVEKCNMAPNSLVWMLVFVHAIDVD
jgi:hypothetical protein